MLVTFSCKAHENITYFDYVAIHLLKLMGHSGTIPGAINADDIATALHHLQEAVLQNKPISNGKQEKDKQVSLAIRAVPLIDLLKAAEKKHCHVMWDKA